MKPMDIEKERAKAIAVVMGIKDAETLHEIALLYGAAPNVKADSIKDYNTDIELANKDIAEGKTVAHEDVVEYFVKWQAENLKK